MTDAEIRYYSIFGEQSGILVSAGTGSICLIRTPDQRFVQIGGWGFLLGDEGSGFDIGRRAIKSVLLDFSKNQSLSDFSQKILLFYGLEKPGNMISIIYSSINPPKLIASCARFVCEEADKGDKQALEIVNQTTEALIDYAIQAIELLDQDDRESYKVALAGGIFRNNSIVERKFRERIQELDFTFEYMKQEMEPASAGVLYALRQDQQKVSGKIINQLFRVTF